MPESHSENYNELIMEFGWIVLFPPACPAAALIAILSNMIQYKTEKDTIKMFVKRGKPLSAMDIGNWLDYFELISTFGIVNSALLIIFTSEKLTWFSPDGDWTWSQLVVAVFIIENILLAFRFIIAALIPDYPDWIEKESFANENRVKQVQSEIDNKSIIEINEGGEIEFVELCLGKLHHDRDLAALHVRKLLSGANHFVNLYNQIQYDQQKEAEEMSPSQFEQLSQQQRLGATGGIQSTSNQQQSKAKKKLPFISAILKKKLRQMSTIIDKEEKSSFQALDED